MMVLHLGTLAGIALSLAILMALAWIVQQRTGNSGWVDTIWTFSVGAVGAGSALWPIGGRRAERSAMAGGSPGGDLVAAAGVAYLSRNRRETGRSALCGRRQRVGSECAAQNGRVSAEPGFRVDPAGVCDLRAC